MLDTRGRLLVAALGFAGWAVRRSYVRVLSGLAEADHTEGSKADCQQPQRGRLRSLRTLRNVRLDEDQCRVGIQTLVLPTQGKEILTCAILHGRSCWGGEPRQSARCVRQKC